MGDGGWLHIIFQKEQVYQIVSPYQLVFQKDNFTFEWSNLIH